MGKPPRLMSYIQRVLRGSPEAYQLPKEGAFCVVPVYKNRASVSLALLLTVTLFLILFRRSLHGCGVALTQTGADEITGELVDHGEEGDAQEDAHDPE